MRSVPPSESPPTAGQHSAFDPRPAPAPNEPHFAAPNDRARNPASDDADDTRSGDDGDERPLNARARHVLDRAREYATLARHGFTPREIARRRRRSKGYVSI